MKKQAGFTLIELAIVLVIIGLLLGGVLRGQELINSARVKSLTRDFQNTQVYIYGYQDRFRAIPGDDPAATTHVNASDDGDGNGQISGQWNSSTATDESYLFWEDVRLAGLAPGPTNPADAQFQPRNSNGGRIVIQSIAAAFNKITGMNGQFAICSDAILGRDAVQIDQTLDDGETSTGTIRAVATAVSGAADTTADLSLPAGASASYTVCMTI
ncbi:MAG TPA: prepilin-type N-terminal cleavage/methylation domain-containing protein [Methylotenera sp.]|nr:prepilin-type N-terminal cleavage/methylation domain-containing protein [Methylotenera sp.]